MWFSSQISGLVGGIGGALYGCLVGGGGAFVGIFAGKGKFKKFILTYLFIIMAVSAILLCVGIFALATGQPYHVWYPFMFIGGMGAIQLPIFYIMTRKFYIKAELKKMNIDDLT